MIIRLKEGREKRKFELPLQLLMILIKYLWCIWTSSPHFCNCSNTLIQSFFFFNGFITQLWRQRREVKIKSKSSCCIGHNLQTKLEKISSTRRVYTKLCKTKI